MPDVYYPEEQVEYSSSFCRIPVSYREGEKRVGSWEEMPTRKEVASCRRVVEAPWAEWGLY